MRVSKKGHVVSGLEADWLELTAIYYGRGWSLVDSFVYWDTLKGATACLTPQERHLWQVHSDKAKKLN